MAVANKTTIAFSLVSVPISMYTAVQDNDISFNQLHEADGQRVRYKKVCGHCGQEVKNEDIVKGYEYEENKYITINEEDLEKIKTEKDKSIQILHFANLNQIRISISRYIENEGIKLFELTSQNELEGIVAKKKDSKYYFDKRTKDWIKIKNYEDEEFIICGYIEKEANTTSIVIAQNNNGKLEYKGHVTLGVSKDALKIIKSQHKLNYNIFDTKEDTVWIEPNLICTIKYMEKTENGNLRQPVFKGIRNKDDISNNQNND